MQIRKAITVIAFFFAVGTSAAAQFSQTSIFEAITGGDSKLFAEMLEKDPKAVVEARLENGITPLQCAAACDNVDAIYRLVKVGFPVDLIAAKSKTTALHWAADKGSLDSVRILLKYGANIDKQAANGWTPLHFAAKWNASEVVKCLLENDADPDVTDANGWTPLHVAANLGGKETVEALLAGGADVSIRDENGQTAGQVAANDEIAALINPETTAETPKVPQTHEIIVADAKETTPPVESAAEAAEPDAKSTAAAAEPDAKSTAEAAEPDAKSAAGDKNETVKTPYEKLTERQILKRFLNNPATIQFSDGSAYQGETHREKFHGYGTLLLPNRDYYMGQFSHGMRDGVGTYTYSNGDSYTGQWKHDVPHGDGVFSYRSGGKVNGVWKNGALVTGNGIIVQPNGKHYSVKWAEGKISTSFEIDADQDD